MKKVVGGLVFLCFTLLSAQSTTNILGDKGKFEGTLTGKGWALETNGEAKAEPLALDSTPGVAKEGKSCGKIVVTKVTSENWHVQLKDPTWPAKKGYKYTFTMWAKADSIRTAQISVYGSEESQYTYRTSTRITLTTEWQQFSQVFISDVEGNGKLNFAFVCGFEVGTYYIDDVAIEEGIPDNNLYANGGFEAGGAQWNLYVNSGKATMSILSEGAHSGSKFCRIEVTEKPEENWQIQLQDGSWKAKIGCIYTFSFWAKSDSERTIHVAAQSGGSRNYKYMMGEDKFLTTEWEEYSFTYYNDSLEGNDSLNFFIYCGASAGKYDFDDISLTISSCDTPTQIIYLKEKTLSFNNQMNIRIIDNKLLCKFNNNQLPELIKIYDVKGKVFGSYNVLSNTITLKRPPAGMWIVNAKGYKPQPIIIH
ncbi:MAG: carbohydrate binding domain-containing protein [Chitinispirillaceae bacterium]|nr:carbohydrate binding domain-containing protein [Chitinispirillaceae bacterium]